MRVVGWLVGLMVLAPLAQAAELHVLSPGFVYNAGLQDLAAEYQKKTGVKVIVESDTMKKIIDDIKNGTPAADVIVLPLAPVDLMGTLALDKGIVAQTFTPLGRVEIGLAVKAGAPHPDISSVDKLVNVLNSAQAVLYSNPATGSMEASIIDRMLKRPEFAGVHGRISSEGEGGQALRRGEGDMALQLICEVFPYPDISLVAKLPPELGAHMDGALAVSARSAHPKDAAAFIAYITRPEAASTWRTKGLDRF
jgi:molybdate transport system substrate-binding protein